MPGAARGRASCDCPTTEVTGRLIIQHVPDCIGEAPMCTCVDRTGARVRHLPDCPARPGAGGPR